MFDFSKTESAQEASYLKPGVYTVKVTDVALGTFPKKGTAYLGITFKTESELTIQEKFILSEAALGRLQYLHEAWTGKKIDKAFKSADEVEAYFKKVFLSTKAGTRNLIVGGEVNDKNQVFGSLPFTNFIAEKGQIDMGEFTEGSDEWKKYVKKSSYTSDATGKKNGALNDDGPTTKGTLDTTADDNDDLPW